MEFAFLLEMGIAGRNSVANGVQLSCEYDFY